MRMVLVSLLLVACSHSKHDGPLCTPGVTMPCTCPDGKTATALCDLDGEAFVCNCNPAATCTATCGAGQVCMSGSCVAAPYGVACTSDSDCGQGNRCRPDAAGWPGGYCLVTCAQNADCSAGKGACETFGASKYCLSPCAASTDCRTNYACAISSTGTLGCEPPCASSPALLCGGFSCSSDGVNCNNPNEDICQTNPTSCSANSTCVSGQYCECTATTDCGNGRTCIVTSSGSSCGCATDAICGTGHTCDTSTGACS